MTSLRRHVMVETDMIEMANWIARDSMDVAEKFLDAVEKTLTDLRYLPAKGSRKRIRDRRFSDLRSWAIQGFPRHLVFYDLREDGIFVLAVVRGSRNWARLLKLRVD